MIKKQFTLYLENKPGALAKVTRQLGNEKVNIDGISVAESTDVSLVQVVASNAAATKCNAETSSKVKSGTNMVAEQLQARGPIH